MRVLFDASALAKRYIAEPGREQLLALSAKASEVVVAAHCKAEIASALNRQRHEGVLADEDYRRIMAVIHEDFAELECMAMDRRVEALAMAAMEATQLHAFDALPIGTAQAAGVDLFVTADRRQAAAAAAVGLRTELIQA
ncbi:type II toxin-antitoxin system VapC family toxin [uncultured Pseudacidovorax sp.]|uniref:type II toxin-antitoxin system VapC family toxin n=1 Tax=uncultured Pseudacidovorax sp. TaxID=679313 RepID=UPI0025F7F5B0|nr:type II toxin-antitoxin system VapC family toxin [uncultured Pseudacidovorax sp.]